MCSGAANRSNHTVITVGVQGLVGDGGGLQARVVDGFLHVFVMMHVVTTTVAHVPPMAWYAVLKAGIDPCVEGGVYLQGLDMYPSV